MDCCQSSYVCFASSARVAMTTIKYARASNTIVWSFFRRYFSTLSCIIYRKPGAQIKILSMLRIKLNLFLSPCQKLLLFETICSLPAVREVDDFLAIFCPYLEFFTSLLWQLFASLKTRTVGVNIEVEGLIKKRKKFSMQLDDYFSRYVGSCSRNTFTKVQSNNLRRCKH